MPSMQCLVEMVRFDSITSEMKLAHEKPSLEHSLCTQHDNDDKQKRQKKRTVSFLGLINLVSRVESNVSLDRQGAAQNAKKAKPLVVPKTLL